MNRAPFRPFFLLAAIDAVLGAAIWVPMFAPQVNAGQMTAEWHRSILLFGMVPALLGGFLLTAVPRWTRMSIASLPTMVSLFALCLCAGAAFVIVSPAAGVGLVALFLLQLSILVGGAVIATRDGRNLSVVVLLVLFCCGAALTALSWREELAQRLALAALVALMTIIGGRLVPALTLAYAGQKAMPVAASRRAWVEQGAAWSAAVALCAWTVLPHAPVTGLLGAGAALMQLARAAQWRSWHSGASMVMALHLGYGWIVAGFALLAIQILAPTSLTPSAVIHAWTVGAMGTMAIAIMSSMIRRHSGLAFAKSAFANLAVTFVTLSCMSRLLAGLVPGPPSFWIMLSALLWVAAFCSFLIAYGRLLLPWNGSRAKAGS